MYTLGAVFLQLCRILRLEQHAMMQKPVDPSLFIHRFADKLSLERRARSAAAPLGAIIIAKPPPLSVAEGPVSLRSLRPRLPPALPPGRRCCTWRTRRCAWLRR